MAEIPVVEPQYEPGLKYRLGCKVIRLVGKLSGVDIDFQPQALPGDRITGYVNCPHCLRRNLVTVSMFNETPCRCMYSDCCRLFLTMNNGNNRIWILLEEGEHDRMDIHINDKQMDVGDFADIVAKAMKKATQKW